MFSLFVFNLCNKYINNETYIQDWETADPQQQSTAFCYLGGLSMVSQQEALTTVLAQVSSSNYGAITYEYNAAGGKRGGWSNMHFYCTSAVLRKFDTSGDWYEIDNELLEGIGCSAQSTFNVNDSRFHFAKSIAIMNDGKCYFKFINLYYATSAQTVLKTGTALGKFYWLSIDGGVIG